MCRGVLLYLVDLEDCFENDLTANIVIDTAENDLNALRKKYKLVVIFLAVGALRFAICFDC